MKAHCPVFITRIWSDHDHIKDCDFFGNSATLQVCNNVGK